MLDYFENQRQAMIDLLIELVNYETPSSDKAAVDKLGIFIETQFKQLNASSVQRFACQNVGDCVLGKWNEDAPGKPILFLAHMDTVWPIGTLEHRPVIVQDDGRLFGPGAADMKGGIVVMMTAIKGLQERDEMPNRPIWALMTGDEEIGSPEATPIIEELAQQCQLVLVMEPATPDGAMKTARKGIATYKLEIEGRASHAGNAPEEGINAIVELAHQTLKLNSLNDLRHGTSVSVTVTQGGTTSNVIPAYANAEIDARFLTQHAMTTTREAILNLQPFLPGAKVTIEEHHARGPMERNAQMQTTYSQCQEIGKKYGLTVREESVGGGSDGNTTASLGIPTLDGLGPQGDGLHAEHEHIIISTLAQRATLIAGILKDWK